MESSNTRKDVRRLLWRWGKVTSTCARKQKELQEYMDLINSVSDVHSSALTGMPGSGQISDRTERAAERLMFLKDRYQEMIDELAKEIEEELRFRDAMDDVIKCVDDPARTVIEMRYKYTWSFTRIARETNYAESWVRQLDGIAVQKIGRHIVTTNKNE